MSHVLELVVTSYSVRRTLGSVSVSLGWALNLLLFVSGTAIAADKPNPDWDAYVQQFLADYFTAHPGFAVGAGKHEFDGQIADFSDAALQKEIKRLHAERLKAAAFKDADLTDHQRFERDYLIAQIDGDLYWLEVADQPHTTPYWYADALDPDVYISREYAPRETRLRPAPPLLPRRPAERPRPA